jgi:hypothetical protein
MTGPEEVLGPKPTSICSARSALWRYQIIGHNRKNEKNGKIYFLGRYPRLVE